MLLLIFALNLYATTIPLDVAYELYQEKAGATDFHVIDVRMPYEYDFDHIPGAINIDFLENDFKDKVSKLDRSHTYLLYCRTGGRGGGADTIFAELGFENSFNIKGGFEAWEEADYPTDF